jgi:hypothetical protein
VLRLFFLDPDYRDSWSIFQSLYASDDVRRRADRALANHPATRVTLAHRAELALGMGLWDRSDSLAGAALAAGPPDGGLWMARAAAAFAAGRDSAGYERYDSALAHADADSSEALWEDLRSIATPSEVTAYAGTASGDRRSFFERFWSQRDPDLLTPVNERIAEHYRRVAEARRIYPVLHPLSVFIRSPWGRALARASHRDARQTAIDSIQAAPNLDAVTGLDPSLGDPTAGVAARLNPDPSESIEAAVAATGFTAQGLIWLRHGPPAARVGDFWLYQTPDGPVWLLFSHFSPLFVDPTDGPDMIVLGPRSPIHQSRLQERLEWLERHDRTAVSAPLEARGWVAFFKSALRDHTILYTKAEPDTAAAAALWSSRGTKVDWARGPGLIRLTAPPGAYQLGVDVDSAGLLGRARLGVHLPAYSDTALALSSLALAPGDSIAGREAVLRGMPGDLEYPADRSLVAYCEIYGLAPDDQGRVRYTVRYRFAPVKSLPGKLLGHARPVTIELTRERRDGGVLPEQIVIAPGRLPPGRYRVTVEVVLRPGSTAVHSTELEIRIK